MSPNDELLNLVQDLAAARPFRAEGVTKITGHHLQPSTESSNPYFSMFTSRDDKHRFLSATELRVPRPGSGATAQDGILILDVQPQLCVGQKEVMARFGEHPELSVPTPHQPPDSPIYFVYRVPWGAMRFGFQRGGQECLTKVILDATGR